MIQSFAVTNVVRGNNTEWFPSDTMLPNYTRTPESFYAICNSNSHCFLTVLDQEHQRYFDYDTCKSIIPEAG
jgi:hypothetical protein